MLISVKAALPAIRAPGFAVLLALLLVCALPPLSAAPAERHYRLFILDSQFGNPYDEVRDALLATLSEAGYRSGVNLQVDMEAAGNAVEQGERILQRVLDGNYDVVFVGGTVATIAARNVLYGRDQPVVFGSPTDPVGIGVIENF
jgi:putative ABC transport system substrate-binding protein